MQQYKKIDWEDFKTIKYDQQYAQKMVFFKDFEIDDIFNLDAAKYPDLKEELKTINKWNRGTEVSDTNFALVYKTLWYLYNHANEDSVKHFQKSSEARYAFFAEALRNSQKEMFRDFGSIHIPLGELQRLTRGDKDLPVGGGPDVIRSAYPQEYKNGRFRVFVGESYILLVKFTKDGPEIHSVSPYGASNKPDSKHYTDQMELYVNKQTKPMTFNKVEIYKKAETIYHPK
jgi:acyl-homoserine-lactone acylase